MNTEQEERLLALLDRIANRLDSIDKKLPGEFQAQAMAWTKRRAEHNQGYLTRSSACEQLTGRRKGIDPRVLVTHCEKLGINPGHVHQNDIARLQASISGGMARNPPIISKRKRERKERRKNI